MLRCAQARLLRGYNEWISHVAPVTCCQCYCDTKYALMSTCPSTLNPTHLNSATVNGNHGMNARACNGDIYLLEIYLLVFLDLLFTMLTALLAWLTTISSIFRRCCSNAIIEATTPGSVLTLLLFSTHISAWSS